MAGGLTIAEQMQHVTAPVVTDTGVGTGFFYSVELEHQLTYPLLITNRHVIEGAKHTHFRVTSTGDDGRPEFGVFLDFDAPASDWVFHPDPSIDLAMLMVGPRFKEADRGGNAPFQRSLTWENVAKQTYLTDMDAIENIVMIGYPTGIYDQLNNLPVTRRGITASRIGMPYNGKPEFLIDCACFPGSSGSPVFHYETGGYGSLEGVVRPAQRVVWKFIGVLYAGPIYDARGEINAVPIETATKQIAQTKVMINLGYCIRAEQLHGFHKPVQDFISGL